MNIQGLIWGNYLSHTQTEPAGSGFSWNHYTRNGPKTEPLLPLAKSQHYCLQCMNEFPWFQFCSVCSKKFDYGFQVHPQYLLIVISIWISKSTCRRFWCLHRVLHTVALLKCADLDTRRRYNSPRCCQHTDTPKPFMATQLEAISEFCFHSVIQLLEALRSHDVVKEWCKSLFAVDFWKTPNPTKIPCIQLQRQSKIPLSWLLQQLVSHCALQLHTLH